MADKEQEQTQAEEAETESPTPAEEVKAEESQPTEEVKAEEAKAEEAKPEEAKAEKAKAEEAKPKEAKAEEAKAEEAKPKEAKAEKSKKSKKAKEEKEAEAPGPAEEEKAPEPDQAKKVRVGLIGKKLGMTQVFDDTGRAIPVTVIQAGPCVVVQKKTQEKEGYSSLQLGFVEGGKLKANKPTEGHFKKAGVPPTRLLREFAFEENEGEPVKVGDQILVHNVFSANDLVNVSGRSIGRGFQGVMKRHGFSGGKATHGSMFHRAPGSIGASAYPSRVMPGIKMPGRMGNQQMKIRNLKVVQVDEENHLLVVKGAVPGSTGGYVTITRA